MSFCLQPRERSEHLGAEDDIVAELQRKSKVCTNTRGQKRLFGWSVRASSASERLQNRGSNVPEPSVHGVGVAAESGWLNSWATGTASFSGFFGARSIWLWRRAELIARHCDSTLKRKSLPLKA
jgi:hypothetical protein